MKKIYATMLVAALGAGTMFAQTFSTVWTKTYDVKVGAYDETAPNWSNPSAVKATPGMHNAIGVNGKLYGIDMTTMSVTSFDANGYQKAYDLPSLDGQTITYIELNDGGALKTSADYYGSLISRDDAGNLLIGHGYGTGATANTWTVLDKNGNAKRLVYDFGADYHACLPTEIVGRAIGDVTKEGYLYVGPVSIFWPVIKDFAWGSNYPDVQRTKMLSFTGDGTAAGTTMTGEMSGHAPLGNWFLTTCSPWYANLEEMKAEMATNPEEVTLNQTFFMMSKATGSCGMINQYGAMFGILDPVNVYKLLDQDISFGGSELVGTNYSLYAGFDTFVLGGNRYYVASFTEDAEEKNNGILTFGIFDEEGYLCYASEAADAEPLVISFDDVAWEDEGEELRAGTFYPTGSYNLNVEYVDDENVNIYVWAQCENNGVFAGVFNYGNGKTGFEVGGVEDVTVEANNAEAVYYNLNGVRVANPANGIFIKKCGNKVTKVVK